MPKSEQCAIILYMFGIFKRKTNFLPDDVKKGMLTSNFVSFKMGEKLTIDENLVCFIRFKDKTYKELTSDSYALNKEFLLELYSKQLKKKKKLKQLKADFYFVNLNSFSYEFEYIDKIPLNNHTTKILFSVNLSVNVDDADAFLKFIIYENPAARCVDTQNILIDFVEDSVKKFYLKRELENAILTNEMQKALFAHVEKSLNKIGINLSLLEVSLLKKANKTSKNEEIKEKSGFFTPSNLQEDTKSNQKENVLVSKDIVDQQPKIEYKKSIFKVCPNCKSNIIAGAIYCHKCGTRADN